MNLDTECLLLAVFYGIKAVPQFCNRVKINCGYNEYSEYFLNVNFFIENSAFYRSSRKYEFPSDAGL